MNNSSIVNQIAEYVWAATVGLAVHNHSYGIAALSFSVMIIGLRRIQ